MPRNDLSISKNFLKLHVNPAIDRDRKGRERICLKCGSLEVCHESDPKECPRPVYVSQRVYNVIGRQEL